MLTDKSVKDFLEEVGADSAVPGGGSAAAYTGSLGAGLILMVSRMTAEKDKFADVKKEFEGIIKELEPLKNRLFELIDEDSEAFNEVMNAYRMSKDTEEEKRKRSEAIQKALKRASEVPMETAEICGRIIEAGKTVAKKGSPNAVTDAGTGVNIAFAALKSALYNVKINVGSIKDEKFAEEQRDRAESLLKEARSVSEETDQIVKSKI